MKEPLENQEAQVGGYLKPDGDAWFINEGGSNGFNWSNNGSVAYASGTNFNMIQQIDLEDLWASAPLQK